MVTARRTPNLICDSNVLLVFHFVYAFVFVSLRTVRNRAHQSFLGVFIDLVAKSVRFPSLASKCESSELNDQDSAK